jgi:hypothetical protein
MATIWIDYYICLVIFRRLITRFRIKCQDLDWLLNKQTSYGKLVFIDIELNHFTDDLCLNVAELGFASVGNGSDEAIRQEVGFEVSTFAERVTRNKRD